MGLTDSVCARDYFEPSSRRRDVHPMPEDHTENVVPPAEAKPGVRAGRLQLSEEAPTRFPPRSLRRPSGETL